jgi:hypothetical protein
MQWGRESAKVLKIQAKVLHAIKRLNTRQFCRPVFKQLKIFTVITFCIFEVLLDESKVTYSNNVDV